MATIPTCCALVGRGGATPHALRLAEALAAAGLRARLLRPVELLAAWRTGDDRPAVAVCRLPSGTPPDELSSLLPLERDGLPWVNRPSALAAVHDKPSALDLLARAGLPVVPTVVVRRDDDASLDALPGDVLVVKPAEGAAGRGVTLGLSRAAARERARAFADLVGPVLVQPFVGDGTDRRLFVVGGQVVAAMERVPAAPGGRASTHYGGRARVWRPSPEELALGRSAAEVLRLDVAGVDLVTDGSGPRLLEVNAAPGLTAIEAATGRDVAGAIAALAGGLAGPR